MQTLAAFREKMADYRIRLRGFKQLDAWAVEEEFLLPVHASARYRPLVVDFDHPAEEVIEHSVRIEDKRVEMHQAGQTA